MADYKIQIRRDTAANWTSVNPILNSGELGYDTTNKVMKVGDSSNTWANLPTFVDQVFTAVEKNKLAGIVSVTDYGAVGDNVANDATAFRNAISAAPTGAVILVPAPSVAYRFTSSVVVDKKVFFIGAAQINVVGGIIAFNLTAPAAGSQFTGLYVNGDRSTGQKGIYSIANHVSVHDCSFTMLDMGLHVGGGLNFRAENLAMRNVKDTAIYLADGSHHVVRDVFYDTDGSWYGGSYAAPSYGIRVSAKGSSVHGCTMRHPGRGLVLDCLAGTDLSEIVVSDCVFSECLGVESILIRNQTPGNKIKGVLLSGVKAFGSRQSVIISGSNTSILDTVFSACNFYENTNEGVRVEVGSRTTFVGCNIGGNSGAGANAYPDVYLSCSGEAMFEACHFGQIFGYTTTPSYAVNADSSGNLKLLHNSFTTGYVQGTLLDNTTGTVTLRANAGLVTENSGSATIAAGNTQVVVNHGLSRTPNIAEISATPTSTWGSATKYWVSTPTESTFVINVNIAPGGSGMSFSWHAMITER